MEKVDRRSIIPVFNLASAVGVPFVDKTVRVEDVAAIVAGFSTSRCTKAPASERRPCAQPVSSRCRSNVPVCRCLQVIGVQRFDAMESLSAGLAVPK